MGKQVLIIEDSNDIQEILRQILELEGYSVLSALNGQEALDILQSSPQLPNMILLDLMMPIMDGFEFRKLQKMNPRFAGIPVVVITADGDIQAKKMRVGANDYLKKPVDIERLLDVVKQNCV